jgi:hypothetical protein
MGLYFDSESTLTFAGLFVGPGGERVRDSAGETPLGSLCGLWDVFWIFLGLFTSSSSEDSESDDSESDDSESDDSESDDSESDDSESDDSESDDSESDDSESVEDSDDDLEG